MLASLYVSMVILVAAFLFEAVGRLEPNRRLAIVFKCAISRRSGNRKAIVALRASPLAMGYGSIDFHLLRRAPPGRERAVDFGGAHPIAGPPEKCVGISNRTLSLNWEPQLLHLDRHEEAENERDGGEN